MVDEVSCRALSRLLVAAVLLAAGSARCQQSGGASASSADAQQDCRSVVLVQCAPAPAGAGAGADATRQKLEARRLRQVQAQAGLNAVEVTGEAPTGAEADPWDDFRQSVASAAVPGCLGQDPLPSRNVTAQGLLRLPFVLHAAAVGKCR